MKKFWKVLGLGALAAGLIPYKVEKNEETGENSYQALLWRITSAPGEGENKREIGINLGEGTLTSKLVDAVTKGEEAEIFSDELTVNYTGADEEAEEEIEEAAEEVEKAVEEVEEAVKKAAEETEEAVKEVEETVREVEEAVKEAAEESEEE